MAVHFAPKFSLTEKTKKNLRFIEQVRSTIQLPKSSTLKKRCLERERYHFYQIDGIDASEAYQFAIGYDKPISEPFIKKLHSLILHKKSPTPYRKGQNAVFDANKKSVYLPPKPEDVAPLMKELVKWLNSSNDPAPIRAAVAHFGINSIHPYYDGNGRCARLLTKTILHQAGYDLQGLLCLEDYYLKNLEAYYKGLTIKNSLDYYTGPAVQPITSWIDYFCEGMAYSLKQALKIL